MKITAITKFKQGDLYAAMKKLEWSHKQLSQEAKVPITAIGHLVNLRRRPNPVYLQRIQKALAKNGIYLDTLQIWPEAFKGFGKSPVMEQTQEIPIDHLLYAHHIKYLNANNENGNDIDVLKHEAKNVINEVMQDLNKKQRTVLQLRFWGEKTLKEIAQFIGVKTTEQVRQYEARALRKMRSPKRLRKLEGYVYGAFVAN